MRATTAKTYHERFFEIAESQHGYFTTAQAVESGFSRSTHSYHVQSGNWVREHRGIYRLRRFPRAPTVTSFSGRSGPVTAAVFLEAFIRI
jgi:Transcriptional regulator, AbiEi antitoxin